MPSLRPQRSQVLRWALPFFSALILVGGGFWIDWNQAIAWVGAFALSQPVLAKVAFALLYAAAVLVGFPAALFPLAAGAVFGTFWGSLAAWAGEVLSAFVAYVLARTYFRKPLLRRMRGKPWFQSLQEAAKQNSLKVALLLRLVSVTPLSVQHYAFGLLPVRKRDFWLGCLCMYPSTLLLTFMGTTTGNLTEWLFDGTWLTGMTVMTQSLFLLGGVLLLTGTVYLVRKSLSAVAARPLEKGNKPITNSGKA